MSASIRASRKLEERRGDIELTAEMLQRTPLVAGASDAVRKRLAALTGKGAMVLRVFREGESIVRQGDAGWTAFYMLRGTDVRRLALDPLTVEDVALRSVRDPTASVGMSSLLSDDTTPLHPKAEVRIARGSARAPRAKPPAWRRLTNLVYRRTARPMSIEATIALSPDQQGELRGVIREGDLFGEVSCFTHQARTATIVATKDCYVIEMMSNALELALENSGFRQALDRVYRARVLQTDLEWIDAFADAPPEAIEFLRQRAELSSHKPGDDIYRQGDPCDALYFVRRGTVKLSQGKAGGRVLNYATRGHALGTEALSVGGHYETTATAFSPQRAGEAPSSRLARSRTDLVKIDADDIRELMGRFESIRAMADRLARGRRESPMALDTLASSLGLVQAERVMLIDLDLCTRCDDCVQACADTHGGVARLSREGPRLGSLMVATTCRQCLDPTCLIGCPVGSIHRGADDEIVIEDWCIGCGICSEQCPYDAIVVEEGDANNRRAVTCDQCASIGDGTPMCVYACGPGAAQRVDGRSFFDKQGDLD